MNTVISKPALPVVSFPYLRVIEVKISEQIHVMSAIRTKGNEFLDGILHPSPDPVFLFEISNPFEGSCTWWVDASMNGMSLPALEEARGFQFLGFINSD